MLILELPKVISLLTVDALGAEANPIKVLFEPDVKLIVPLFAAYAPKAVFEFPVIDLPAT